MTYELALALIGFAFVSSITPGPNNLMLMASGANFGLRPTVPHALGVALGFVIMTVALGAGLVQLFALWPVTNTIMKGLAVAFLLWLAWKILNAAPPNEAPVDARPLTFLQAAAFQWVNPKALAMSLTAISAYTVDQSLAAVALAAGIFGLVNLPSVMVWVVLGTQLRRILTNRTRLRIFNGTCAALLVATIWPIVTA